MTVLLGHTTLYTGNQPPVCCCCSLSLSLPLPDDRTTVDGGWKTVLNRHTPYTACFRTCMVRMTCVRATKCTQLTAVKNHALAATDPHCCYDVVVVVPLFSAVARTKGILSGLIWTNTRWKRTARSLGEGENEYEACGKEMRRVFKCSVRLVSVKRATPPISTCCSCCCCCCRYYYCGYFCGCSCI